MFPGEPKPDLQSTAEGMPMAGINYSQPVAEGAERQGPALTFLSPRQTALASRLPTTTAQLQYVGGGYTTTFDESRRLGDYQADRGALSSLGGGRGNGRLEAGQGSGRLSPEAAATRDMMRMLFADDSIFGATVGGGGSGGGSGNGRGDRGNGQAGSHILQDTAACLGTDAAYGSGHLGNTLDGVDLVTRLCHTSSFAADAGRRAEDDGRVSTMSRWPPPGIHGGIGGGVRRMGGGPSEDASIDATAAATSFPFAAAPSHSAGLYLADDFARQTSYVAHGQAPRPGHDGGDAGALYPPSRASGSFPSAAPQAAAPEHEPFQQPSAVPIDVVLYQIMQQMTQQRHMQQQQQMLSGGLGSQSAAGSYALPSMSMSHLQQPLATLNHTEHAYYSIPQQQQQADAVQMQQQQQQQAFGFGEFAQRQQNAAAGATAQQQTLGSSPVAFLPLHEQQQQQQQRDLLFQHLWTTGRLDAQQQPETAAVVLPSANQSVAGALPFSTAIFHAPDAPQPSVSGRARSSRRGQAAAAGGVQAHAAAAAPASILDSASDSELNGDDDDDALNSSAAASLISSAALSPRTSLDGRPSNGAGGVKRRASKTTSSSVASANGEKKATRRRVRPPETARQRLRRLERCQRLRDLHRQGREERHKQYLDSEELNVRLTANLARLAEERTRLWKLVLARHSAT